MRAMLTLSMSVYMYMQSCTHTAIIHFTNSGNEVILLDLSPSLQSPDEVLP